MTNHFIKNIHIENFKCFQGFKADDFKRINLIGGKNNIGKTAFMEACYINTQSTDIRKMVGAMISIKFMRENLNLLVQGRFDYREEFMEKCDGISIDSNLTQSGFRIKDSDGKISYEFQVGPGKTSINKVSFSHESYHQPNIKFIDNHGWSDPQILDCYSNVQRKDQESYINDLLTAFDPDVQGFKVISDKPVCKTSDEDYRDITEFGDGLKHLLSISTALFSTENGYLFIDEIDNGIHYTMLEQVWEFIFELAEKHNVQVFATTHSLECISAFNKMQFDRKDSNSSYFELAKKKSTNEIFMSNLDAEQLQYELKNGGRFRGE